jgi:hypothetical protein
LFTTSGPDGADGFNAAMAAQGDQASALLGGTGSNEEHSEAEAAAASAAALQASAADADADAAPELYDDDGEEEDEAEVDEAAAGGGPGDDEAATAAAAAAAAAQLANESDDSILNRLFAPLPEDEPRTDLYLVQSWQREVRMNVSASSALRYLRMTHLRRLNSASS